MDVEFSKPTGSVALQRRLFSSFRGAGYSALQLKSSQYLSYVKEPTRYLDDWGDDATAGCSLILVSPLDPAGIEKISSVAAFGAIVGARRLVLCHDGPRDGKDQLVAQARQLSEIGARTADLGIRLSLHHHYGQPVMFPREMRIFFSAVQHSAVRLTLDTGHLAKAGVVDLGDVFAEFSEVIDNIHLKDFSDGQFRILGDGDLDFAPLLKRATTLPDGVSLCIDEESAATLDAGLTRSQTSLRHLLNEDT